MLNENDELDMETLKHFMNLSSGMEVTFHRAFDRVKNPIDALEQIIQAGCSRILSSGQASTASEGISFIKKLVSIAENRIIIMPGSGIRSNNILEVLQESDAKEIHSSALSDQRELEMVDENEVEKMVKQIGAI